MNRFKLKIGDAAVEKLADIDDCNCIDPINYVAVEILEELGEIYTQDQIDLVESILKKSTMLLSATL